MLIDLYNELPLPLVPKLQAADIDININKIIIKNEIRIMLNVELKIMIKYSHF